MTEVKREHLAGLELALQELSHAYCEFNYSLLQRLIAQASAAPELEPAAYSYSQLIHDSMGGWESRITKHDPRKNQFIKADDLKDVEPLYARPDAEIEQLRADKQYLQRTIDGMNEAHSEVVWRLSEALAMLRERRETDGAVAYLTPDEKDWATRTDAFLSATAQPAECETCRGSQVSATTDKDHEGNSIECRCPMCAQPAEVKS